MRKYLAELTEETAEIKSSDGDQLGIVLNIASNRIVMHVYIGRKGKFVIPEKMIDKIRRGTVYLTLSKKEFEAWWAEEGLKLMREYEKDPEIALGKKLVGEDLQLLRDNIGRAFQSNFDRNIPNDHRQKLCSDQEDLRISLPAHIRDELDSDEWIYHSVDLSLDEEDLLSVTSRRLIRLRSGWGKKHNWQIPIDKMESVSLFTRVVYHRYGSTTYSILRLRYRANHHFKYKEVWIPVDKPWLPVDRPFAEQLESIKEFLESVIHMSKAKPGAPIEISERICSYCGHENPSGAEFCIKCGRQIK